MATYAKLLGAWKTVGSDEVGILGKLHFLSTCPEWGIWGLVLWRIYVLHWSFGLKGEQASFKTGKLP